MHNFCIKTGPKMSTVQTIWTEIAPLAGLQHQFLLDACFATSALHLSRLDTADQHLESRSVMYFERAILGHAEAQQRSDIGSTADALFLTTSLITFYGLARCGNPTPQDDDSMFQWLHLGRGARIVYVAFNLRAQTEAAVAAIHAPPNLMDDSVVFDPANITNDLLVLLEWGADFELMTQEDRTTYAHTLSFISLTYVSAKNGESSLATCRRLLALPSRAPERFHDLVNERRPRALVMLAYHFAACKLIKDDIWWTHRIAERHVARIFHLVPRAWKALMQEPLRLAGLDGPEFTVDSVTPATSHT